MLFTKVWVEIIFASVFILLVIVVEIWDEGVSVSVTRILVIIKEWDFTSFGGTARQARDVCV